MAMTELHEVVHYRGRDVCSCGDFNCASLDVPKQPKIVFNGELRNAVANAYRGPEWKRRVQRMRDDEIYAIFQRLKNDNKL
jgi:hypothetical protein